MNIYVGTRENAARRLLELSSMVLSWVFASIFFGLFYAAVFNPAHEVLIDVSGYQGIGAIVPGILWMTITWNMVLKYAEPSSPFDILGTTFAWAFASLLFVVFYAAALSPVQEVTIDVNAYGEMGMEIILFGMIWLTLSANVVRALKAGTA